MAIISAIKTHPNRAPANIPPKTTGPMIKPTATGEPIAIAPGNNILFRAALVAISTHLALSGSALPSSKPGISLNCLLISSIISNAASPTAVIVIEETRNGIEPPINIPIKTLGSSNESDSTPVASIYAAIIARAARAAAPIAKPFPIAAVVLPNSSSESVISLTSLFMPLISAIPPALSATGP